MPTFHREASGEVVPTPAAAPVGGQRPVRLSRVTMLLHARKTLNLVQAVLADGRVPLLRKALFLWACTMLAVALLIPDAGSALGSLLLPVVGPLLDLPADAAIDWGVAMTIAPWLLRLLPADVVAEHYETIFSRGRRQR